MFRLFRLLFGVLVRIFSTHRSLVLENLVLRQQLTVLKRRHSKPRLTPSDILFSMVARRAWSDWKQCLVIVNPETVVWWHRAGFRMYWSWLSRHRIRTGKTQISEELPKLIFRTVAENPTWSASRIHEELQMLGFDLSERTVSGWIRRVPKSPRKAFLKNRHEATAAMDFFTVHTVTFDVIYCFFLIGHDHRRIFYFNVRATQTASASCSSCGRRSH